jgi:hypothetical protein
MYEAILATYETGRPKIGFVHEFRHARPQEYEQIAPRGALGVQIHPTKLTPVQAEAITQQERRRVYDHAGYSGGR